MKLFLSVFFAIFMSFSAAIAHIDVRQCAAADPVRERLVSKYGEIKLGTTEKTEDGHYYEFWLNPKTGTGTWFLILGKTEEYNKEVACILISFKGWTNAAPEDTPKKGEKL